jgi:hypothetical protein
MAIARRSAWLAARLRGESFAPRDAVRLAAISQSTALRRCNSCARRPRPKQRFLSAALGAPTPLSDAVGLYGGDPQQRFTLLPNGRERRASPFWAAPSLLDGLVSALAAGSSGPFAHSRARRAGAASSSKRRCRFGATTRAHGVALAAIEASVRRSPGVAVGRLGLRRRDSVRTPSRHV